LEPEREITMATREEVIDTAKAAALAEELSAAASGKMGFDAGALLSKIQERPDIEQTVASNADDYVTIYDNMTGVSSTVPLYMLAKKLRQRYPNENAFPAQWRNKPVFALEQRTKPVGGKYVCWFHDDSPHRDEMNELGYVGVHCTKGGIPTEIEVDNHVMHKHSNSYKGIVRARDTRRADGQNKALLDLLTALIEREK
jgi:hypothetical protein